MEVLRIITLKPGSTRQLNQHPFDFYFFCICVCSTSSLDDHHQLRQNVRRIKQYSLLSECTDPKCNSLALN